MADNLFPKGQILLGFKGESFLDTGYFYCPYVPLTQAIIIGFWANMNYYLAFEDCCEACGERVWFSYRGGHIRDECLNCSDHVGRFDEYVGNLPQPQLDTQPDLIETTDFICPNTGSPIDDLEPHERYYRRIK